MCTYTLSSLIGCVYLEQVFATASKPFLRIYVTILSVPPQMVLPICSKDIFHCVFPPSFPAQCTVYLAVCIIYPVSFAQRLLRGMNDVESSKQAATLGTRWHTVHVHTYVRCPRAHVYHNIYKKAQGTWYTIDKRKSQNKLAREHRCLNRDEFEAVTENSRDKSSSLPTRILV